MQQPQFAVLASTEGLSPCPAACCTHQRAVLQSAEAATYSCQPATCCAAYQSCRAPCMAFSTHPGSRSRTEAFPPLQSANQLHCSQYLCSFCHKPMAEALPPALQHPGFVVYQKGRGIGEVATILVCSSAVALAYNVVHSMIIRRISSTGSAVLGEVKVLALLVASALLFGEVLACMHICV